jgi:hypothetical protein
MEIIRALTKRPRPEDMMALGLFVIAAVVALFRRSAHSILAGIAFTMILLGALPRQLTLALLVGASVILLLQRRSRYEGFADSSETHSSEEEEANDAADEAAEHVSANDEDMKEQIETKAKEGFSRSKPLLPDNATRKEPLVLGKPYKLPSESDDKDYHLDAGTTFLNAYKALKPDQIAAMTSDTQELLNTQKSLVAMLDSFAPILKDMNKITGFFGPSS